MDGFNLTTIAPFANAQLIKNEMIDSGIKFNYRLLSDDNREFSYYYY